MDYKKRKTMLIRTKKTSRENPVYFDTKTGIEIVLNKVRRKKQTEFENEKYRIVKTKIKRA
jgi:hypothetical protein